MKISKFSKNKNKISTETISTSMEVEITNQGNINISTEDATFGVVEKTKPEVHIVSDNPTFVVDADKNKKISVVMISGLRGKDGEKGEKGDPGDLGELEEHDAIISLQQNKADLIDGKVPLNQLPEQNEFVISDTEPTDSNVEMWIKLTGEEIL